MAEIDDVRSQIAQAAQSGDEATVARLSTHYRDLQARAGQLAPVGRGFVAQTGREYQLAQRALTARRAGREDEAHNLTRVIARERMARQITRNGGGRGEAALFGANRGIFNLGTLASGAVELVEDTVGGNRNGLTARESMEDYSAVQDTVRERHPVSSGAGEIGGAALTLAAPGGGAARAVQATRVARVGRAVAQGAGYGAVQGGSDAAVRNQDIVEGAERGAGTGAAVGGGLSVAGQALAPAARALANRFLDNQGLRRLAEHVSPQQLNAIVAATRQYQRQFNRAPTLLQAASMADETIAASAGRIVEGRAPASHVARRGVQATRVQSQRDLAEAAMPGSSTVSARTNKHPVTTTITDAAMAPIEGSAIVARGGTPLHAFLSQPNVRRVINSMTDTPEQRDALRDAIDYGGPVSIRMLENIRERVGNIAKLKGASRALLEVVEGVRRFSDEASRGEYSRILRQHGQNAFREQFATAAKVSPSAARSVANNLADSADTAISASDVLGPAAATSLRNVGSSQQRILRGADAFEPPRAVSASEEASNVAGELVKAAALPRMGGAGVAATVIRAGERLGMTTGEAERFARDFADPSQTQRAIQFLQARIGKGPTNNFMQMLEDAGVRPTVERAAVLGARRAAQGPDTQPPDTLEPAPEPTVAPEQAEATSQEAPAASRFLVDINARAEDALNAGDEAAASELQDLSTRLSEIEQLIHNALRDGDETGASALRDEYFAILNNER